MRWNKRGKDGRFISELQCFDNLFNILPTKELMVIKAPKGSLTILHGANYDTACKTVRAFMEQHCATH